LSSFRFWNEGDFQLFKKAFKTNARFKFFQYGAYLKSDIDFVTQSLHTDSDKESLDILVNHSGTRSGNHIDILKRLKSSNKDSRPHLHAVLSYGDQEHIEKVSAFGAAEFGRNWHGYTEFMPRLDYYKLLSKMDIAIFGHRRQEAGNSLFISMLLGTKIFIHNHSVLLPYLEQHGFHFYTLADIGSPGWANPLNKEQREVNKSAALAYFDQVRIEQAYKNLAKNV
jgi:hypothetical protein